MGIEKSKQWFHDKQIADSYYYLVKTVLLPRATFEEDIKYYEEKAKQYEEYWGVEYGNE